MRHNACLPCNRILLYLTYEVHKIETYCIYNVMCAADQSTLYDSAHLQNILLLQVRLVTDKSTNKPRGYAFIEYVHTRAMKGLVSVEHFGLLIFWLLVLTFLS